MLEIALIFGGPSKEHDISLLSAKSIFKNLRGSKYKVRLIAVTKSRQWHIVNDVTSLVDYECKKGLCPVACLNGVDVAFNIIHGDYGEDGTLQGFFEVLGLAYIGAGRVGAHNSYDKEICKLLLRNAQLPIVDFVVLRDENTNFYELSKYLKPPFFVKPALAGSSFGITQVFDQRGLEKALCDAFKICNKVLVEESICGREIECAIIGSRVSVLSEIVTKDSFYDFDAKYIKSDQAKLICPITIEPLIEKEIQKTALKAAKILEVTGMARVDFFVTEDEKIYVNEVNAIPGFTNISLFTKMFEMSGLCYDDMIALLVENALAHKSLV